MLQIIRNIRFAKILCLLCLSCHVQAGEEVCFSDDFENASHTSNNWKYKKNANSDPEVVNWDGSNQLRLSGYHWSQLAMATYKSRIKPRGIVTISFKYSILENLGKDAHGLVVALSEGNDGEYPNIGGNNQAMGYTNNRSVAGMQNGWLGIAIDTQGNFSSTGGWKVGGPGQRPRRIAVRGRKDTSWAHIHTSNYISHLFEDKQKWTITLNSFSENTYLWVTRKRIGHLKETISNRVNINSLGGQGKIPARLFVSFIGSTGGSTFNPRLIDDVKICYDTRPRVDHFRLEYSANPTLCVKENIKITACLNSSCSEKVTQDGDISLTVDDSSAASFESSAVSMNSGNGTATTKLRGKNTNYFTMGVTSTNMIINNPPQCKRGNGSFSQSACTFAFSESGFVLEVPTKYSGKPVTGKIKAVKKSDSSTKCVPSMQNVTKNIRFWGSHVSPSNPVKMYGAIQKVKINGTQISHSAGAPSIRSISFDSNGEGTFAVDYPDAGKLGLSAKFKEGWIDLEGSTNFVSVPVGLCVEPTVTTCAVANANCPILKKAGETVDVKVSGRIWLVSDDGNLCNNAATPNFQSDITVSPHVVSPSGGSVGNSPTSTFTINKKLGGIHQKEMRIDEVGVFKFKAKAKDDYQGLTGSMGDIPPAWSKAFGRFTPHSIKLINTNFTSACGTGPTGFSYFGQPYNVSFTFNARNKNGETVTNYRSSNVPQTNYAKATYKLVAEDDNNGNDLTSRLSLTSTYTANFNNGLAVASLSPKVTKQIPPYVDGPFSQFATGVEFSENDGIKLADLDMKPNSWGACGTSCTAKTLGTQQAFFGRLRMQNTEGPNPYGSTTHMPIFAEYWDGAQFATNLLDQCTKGTNVAHGYHTFLANGDYEPPVSMPYYITRTGDRTMVDGKTTIEWTLYHVIGHEPYVGRYAGPLHVAPWLKYYWNHNGSQPNFSDNPKGGVFFGRPNRLNKSIYWKESF